ncbi:hypothetical protein [Mycolicibacterium rhodesiae]|uniref:Glycosyltransferase RgtA/B/C/D-like domain-containing protein n=1 Tax=Mycolicibacterium rhodesiae TaxID=36814 RepID=A0A1X0IM90_MYCRH|nr:hypothetical protein [Mycolicibacterium rhodesiae]MCV7347658.1 hypothetical protein [Mycolicibacterium rhodesiae]ORB49234.1 hypothetical protein BST42_23575 [Mycolicibacterium rhodesiae]
MITQERGFRLVLGVLAFAAMTAATSMIGWYHIFTGFFRDNDDEGYFLFSLKSFLDSGWHYDGTTGYGPFYYEFWGSVLSISGFEVGHDNSRLMTLFAWVLTCVLFGLSAWWITRSAMIGLLTQYCTFLALFSLAREPMHPAAIIALLLSVIVVFACFVREHTARLPLALLGGAVMALILIKINIGVFALAAVALVAVVTYPALRRIRWVRPLGEFGVVALPLLLMNSKLSEPWTRHFAFHISAAALAVVITLRAREVDQRDSRELWWLGGGFAFCGAAVFLVLVAAGTTPSTILDGTIILPLRFPNLLSFPLLLPSWTYILDLLAVAGAIGYWYATRNLESLQGVWWIYLSASLSFLIGLAMVTSVSMPMNNLSPLVFATFAWAALARLPNQPPAKERTAFVRSLLPPMAVLQTLQAFPIPFVQSYWGGLLLIPVGMLCIANGIRWVASTRNQHAPKTHLARVCATTAAVGVAILMGLHVSQVFKYVRAAFEGSTPLGLRGAEMVRDSPDKAANVKATVAKIEAQCQSLVGHPEMASFYLWTDHKLPAGYDPTSWSLLFDGAPQQKAVQVMRSLPGLCVLENKPQIEFFWGPDSMKLPNDTLNRYFNSEFSTIAEFGDYTIKQQKTRN